MSLKKISYTVFIMSYLFVFTIFDLVQYVYIIPIDVLLICVFVHYQQFLRLASGVRSCWVFRLMLLVVWVCRLYKGEDSNQVAGT